MKKLKKYYFKQQKKFSKFRNAVSQRSKHSQNSLENQCYRRFSLAEAKDNGISESFQF
jgi:phage-related tail protein